MMQPRDITRGETVAWRGTWVHRDGSPVDFSVGTRHGLLRITHIDGGTVHVFDTRNAAHWTWDTGGPAAGIGFWTLDKDATLLLTAGRNLADAVYYDEGFTPTEQVPQDPGCVSYVVSDPCVGAYS